MADAEFWTLIEVTHGAYEALLEALARLPTEEIIAFDDHVWHFSNVSYRGDLWCVAYVAMGGCSDDGFDYFRGWLITKGEIVFKATLQDPDSLVDVLAALKERNVGAIPQDEDILGGAAKAYQKKTGKKDYYDLPRIGPGLRLTVQIQWQPDDVDSMMAICPRVFASFWEDPF